MEKNLRIPGVVTTWGAKFRRTCNICKLEAEFVDYASNGKLKMQCPRKHVFTASPGRLETWYGKRDSMIEFYIRRKEWARNLLRENNLVNPYESITGEFEGRKYFVEIGPRHGVRITP